MGVEGYIIVFLITFVDMNMLCNSHSGVAFKKEPMLRGWGCGGQGQKGSMKGEVSSECQVKSIVLSEERTKHEWRSMER